MRYKAAISISDRPSRPTAKTFTAPRTTRSSKPKVARSRNVVGRISVVLVVLSYLDLGDTDRADVGLANMYLTRLGHLGLSDMYLPP